MSVHASLDPGNTLAFREAHSQCSRLLRNPTDGNLPFRYTPMRLRIGSCLLVIKWSQEYLGLQFTFAYPAEWLARCVRLDRLILVPSHVLALFENVYLLRQNMLRIPHDQSFAWRTGVDRLGETNGAITLAQLTACMEAVRSFL